MCLRPDPVVCERVTPTVEAVAHFWVEFRVGGEALGAASSSHTLPADANMALDDREKVI